MAKAKGSRSREVRLNSSCVVVVDRSDVVAVASLEETIVLKEKVAEANTKNEDEVHQEFATQCATYLETIEKQADELKVKKDFVNRGRVFDEVGERQRRRKLSDFGDSTIKALWFADHPTCTHDLPHPTCTHDFPYPTCTHDLPHPLSWHSFFLPYLHFY